MLNEVVFSEVCGMFADAFEKILVILIDFYEEALRSWKEEARCSLANDVSIDEVEAEEAMAIYALTKVLSFIPANNFLRVIGGIYHDINPSNNMTYLQRVVVILKDILQFSFLDVETVRNSLQMVESNLDYRLNKAINKDFILTIFLNISYSEDDNIIEVLKMENIFGRITESVELYGIK
jgi:hypothetical protein